MADEEDGVLRVVQLHGHPVSYRTAGSGPALLLIHGITGSSVTWGEILPMLAERFTVIAPDLLGHGSSAKPRGDYSLGAYASGVRDLLALLGHDSVTVVGHSMGGGIAMQFAYQFPQACDRLVLVSSGGLGPEVSGVLRAASLPGSEFVLPLVTAAPLRGAADVFGALLSRLGLRTGFDLEEMWRGWSSLRDRESRAAFVHTLRTIIDVKGQRVSAMDRLYLAEGVPTMFVWGDQDPVIPVAHAHRAAALVTGSRLEIFKGVGHFPHRAQPVRFTRLLTEFVESTTPLARSTLPELLRAGPA
jgi:pimeloyl-ACP methyl ester carboxylesterase